MSNCKCSMTISVNGDGCRYCQPQEYIDKQAEWLEESRTDYASLEAECERLREALQKFADLGIEPGNSKWPELDEALACCEAAMSAKP